MRKSIFIILLYALFFQSVNLLGKTTLAFKIINPNEPNIHIVKKIDLLFEKEKEETFLIQAKETFVYNLDIEEPTVLKIIHDFRCFELFVEPNDELEMTIDGDVFPNDIVFKGKGSLHNAFLAGFRQSFITISHKSILKKLYNSSAADYKAWIDDIFQQKWKKYHQYEEEKKSSFSQTFKSFIEAEINYWRAFYLMSFYDEHLSILTNEHFYIPDDFYNFLDEVQINNEQAMNHRYYRKFIRLYADFRLDNKAFPKGMMSRQRVLTVTAPFVAIFDNEKCANQPSGKILKGTNIIVKEALTYVDEKNEKIAYRLRGISTDGQIGWFRCNGIKDAQVFTQQTQSLEVENYDISSFRDVMRYRNTFDSLRMVVDPDEPHFNAYNLLNRNEDCTPLNKRTVTNHSQYEHNTYYSAPSLKVRTAKGVIGWASLVGLTSTMQKKAFIDQKILINEKSRTAFDELEYYISGSPLYYAIGNILKERIEFDGKEKYRNAYERYKKDCKNPIFTKNFNDFYEKAERLYFLDSVALQSKYRMVTRYNVNFEVPEPLQFRLQETEISAEKMAELEMQRSKMQPTSIVKTKEIKFPEVAYNLAPVVFFGRKNLSDQLKIQLYLYPNIISNTARTLTPQTIKNGFLKKKDFRFETKINEPTKALLVIDGKNIPLFLEPGDSLFFEKNDQNTFVCKGKGAETITYMTASEQLFQQIEKELTDAKNRDIDGFKNFLNAAKERKMLLLDSFTKNNKYTAQFTIFSEADITYWYAANMLKYYRDKKVGDKKFLAFIDNLEVQNDALLGSEQYRLFVKDYTAFKAENKDGAGLVFGEKTLKYLKAEEFRQDLSKDMTVEKWNNLQEFVASNPYPVLSDMVKTPYKAHNAQIGTFAPYFSLKTTQGKNIKINDFEKKIVVIDFWSSNIAGIDTVMENLNKRNARFLKSEDIQFININTDSNRKAALKAIKKYDLKGISLNTAENDVYQSPVNELFGVTKYPTTIIIDKGSKIILDAFQNADNQKASTILLDAVGQSFKF